MTAETWSRVREILEAALERPASEAGAYLDRFCEPDLRADVDSLLAAARLPDPFLDEPQFFPEMFASPGTRIGHYTLAAPAGCGGSGVVYRAHDDRLGRTVAVKLLPLSFGDIDLLKEARLASSLSHPNIVVVHDVLDYRGAPAMVMEFVEGRTLREILDEDGPLDPQSALKYMRQIASALAASHHAGVLHRDLKPANVMVREDGVVKVLDFGIAQSLAGGDEALAAGTRGYMSPEQAAGDRLDARSDIYSFGALCRTMLGGRSPRRWRRLLDGCLAENPRDRFQSMRDVEAELNRPSRQRLLLAACALLFLCGAAMLAYRNGAVDAGPLHLIRLSPADEWTYSRPSMSPDGKSVAYLSNRLSGVEHVWLHAVDATEPMQLTAAPGGAGYPAFTPDGSHVAYVRRTMAEGAGTAIELIPVKGGPVRTLLEADHLIQSLQISPDGRWAGYIDASHGRVMVMALAGGLPKVVAESATHDLAWAPDSRRLFFWNQQDWAGIPIEGGKAVSTGMRAALRQAVGHDVASPVTQITAMFRDRAIFRVVNGDQTHPWEVRFDSRTLQVAGIPRAILSGTERETIFSVNAQGVAAVNARYRSTDFYLSPLDTANAEQSGPARRLTSDSRMKFDLHAYGEKWVSFRVGRDAARRIALHRLDTGQEVFLGDVTNVVLTADQDKLVATRRKGAEVVVSSLRSPQLTRPLCTGCGLPGAPAPDPRFVQLNRFPSDPAVPDPTGIGLLNLETGKAGSWISIPGVEVNTSPEGYFGQTEDWILIEAGAPGATGYARYVLPWRQPAPARSEWVEVPQAARDAHVTHGSDFLFYFEGNQLMAWHFDVGQRRFATQPKPVSGVSLATKDWAISPSGLVNAQSTVRGSVWLTKLID